MEDRRRRWNLNIHDHRIALDSVPAGAATALDIGSGNGLLSFDLAARGLDVVGIDPDEPSLLPVTRLRVGVASRRRSS